MSQNPHSQRQVNQYDKALKENLEITLPLIIKEVLGLEIVESEELPDDIQHTRERKPDLLKRVTDREGNRFVLQIEFQSRNESEMAYRMCEYHIMLMRKYKLPVRQYVIYLKEGRVTMPTSIDCDVHQFRYHMVRISEIGHEIFLRSNNPEIKMLGILAKFEESDRYAKVKQLLQEVQSLTEGDFAESPYFRQLRILVQLRPSIEEEFYSIMETISKFYKPEKDFLYRQGAKEGRAKAIQEIQLQRAKAEREKAIAIALEMKKGGLPVAQIAKFTQLSLEDIEAL